MDLGSCRVVDTFVDAGFGVVQFRLEDGGVIQYTRQIGDRRYSTQYQIGDSGESFVNCSVTNDMFNELVERLENENERS